jgi:hypothetical protein
MGYGTGPVPSHMPVDLPPPIVDSTGRKRVYVNPPVIHVGTGPTHLRKILFTNNTGQKARFWFPNADWLFVGPPAGDKDFDNPFVVNDGGNLELALKPDAGFYDYPYHVYCDASESEAEGNSPPAISCP